MKDEEEEGEGIRVWGLFGREECEGKGKEENREIEELECIKAKEREFGSKRKEFVYEEDGKEGRESLEDCIRGTQLLCKLYCCFRTLIQQWFTFTIYCSSFTMLLFKNMKDHKNLNFQKLSFKW